MKEQQIFGGPNMVQSVPRHKNKQNSGHQKRQRNPAILQKKTWRIEHKRLNNGCSIAKTCILDNVTNLLYTVGTLDKKGQRANSCMSHKKAGGSTRLGRDSNAQRLGVKAHDGELINKGAVIVRQRGTRFHPGKNVRKGKDDTLFSVVTGKVKFSEKKRKRFDGSLRNAKFVDVVTA